MPAAKRLAEFKKQLLFLVQVGYVSAMPDVHLGKGVTVSSCLLVEVPNLLNPEFQAFRIDTQALPRWRAAAFSCLPLHVC